MDLKIFSKYRAGSVAFLLIAAWLAGSVAIARAGVELFPEYESLKPNVAFWKKVYAQYPSSKALVHDKSNLAIIYEVIDLVDPGRLGARRLNRKLTKRVKEKYNAIVKKLATGKPPATPEEKRVLALFGKQPKVKILRAAVNNIRSQTCLKDRFEEGLIRSGAYLAEIKRIFKSYGLPEDLAYLPHVESSFNYKAYSKFGAAGIWQFTRSTGKRFMTVNYTQDERRDPLRSSHAAARYLKENHAKLGDWPLAITAYNHGEAGMLRALKKKGSYQAIFNEYNGGYFKFASRNFYAEFLAARHVARNYRQYFGELNFQAPVRTREVVLAGYLPIRDLIDYFRVDLATVQQLNRGLRNPVYGGQKYVPKGYHLRLPEGNGDMAGLVADIPAELYKPKQKRSLFYRVRRGDTAGQVARSNRIRLRDLILANQLDFRATIYVGQNLRIPVPGEAIIVASRSGGQTAKPKATAVVDQRLAQAESRNDLIGSPVKSSPVAGNIPGEPVASEKPEEKRLAMIGTPGSSFAQGLLENIPGRQVASEKQEKEMSGVKPALPVAVGLPAIEAGPSEAAEAVPPVINPAVVLGNLQVERMVEDRGRRYGIIRVEVGETLGHYADWLEIPTRRIRRLNNFRFGRPIRTDQALKIPFIGKISKQEFEERRYEYHKEIEEDFFAAFRVEDVRVYRVKKGDNIWTLCQEIFELPFWLLKKYNASLDLNALKLSQKLLVPLVEEAG